MRTLPAPSEATAELHVASLVVRTAPEATDAAGIAIALIEGAEVHAAEDGKLVVTLEAASQGEVADRMDAISRLPGVVSALLVYHHAEPLEALEEALQ